MTDADPFLDEVRAMHELRARYQACRTDEERARFLEPFAGRLGDWVFQARDAELPPADLDRVWLLLAGRGFGEPRLVASRRA